MYDIQNIKKKPSDRTGQKSLVSHPINDDRAVTSEPDSFIDITIPQKGTDVNTYDMQNGENDAGNGNVKYSHQARDGWKKDGFGSIPRGIRR